MPSASLVKLARLCPRLPRPSRPPPFDPRPRSVYISLMPTSPRTLRIRAFRSASGWRARVLASARIRPPRTRTSSSRSLAAMSGSRAAPSARPSSRLGASAFARSPPAPSSFSTLRVMPADDGATLRANRTLQPKRSLRDLYSASCTPIGGTPFGHVEAASRRGPSPVSGTLPAGPLARSRSQSGRSVGQRPVSMLVTSSTARSIPARTASSRPSTPVGSSALHRSTSSISSLGSVGSPSSYARPTRSSRAKAGSADVDVSVSLPRSPPLPPITRPPLARSATTSAATRRPRAGRELGVSGTTRRPLSMTRAPSPDQSEGYASMEQVRAASV